MKKLRAGGNIEIFYLSARRIKFSIVEHAHKGLWRWSLFVYAAFDSRVNKWA